MSTVSAECQEPQITTYDACCNNCPDPVKYSQKYADCINNCIAMWSRVKNSYYACKEKELEEPNNQVPDQQNQAPIGLKGTISAAHGGLDLIRNTVTFPVTTDTKIFAGDTIRTDSGEDLDIETDDGTIKIEEDSVVGFIGFDFYKPQVYVPMKPLGSEFDNIKYEYDEMSFWTGLADDIVDFNVNNPPTYFYTCAKAFAKVISPNAYGKCGASVVLFVTKGTLWFKKRINTDVPSTSMSLTPTAAVSTYGTEYAIEVASDGSTSISVLDGSVLVTDLASRKSVIVSSNQTITVPNTENGLTEDELKTRLSTIEPETLDMTEETSDLNNQIMKYSTMFFAIFVLLAIIVFMVLRKKVKK
jgi:hypothetical protein